MAYCGLGGQEYFSLVFSFSPSILAQQTHGGPRGQQQLPDLSSYQSDTLWSQVEGDPVVTSPSWDTAPARMSSPREVGGAYRRAVLYPTAPLSLVQCLSDCPNLRVVLD
ncbi:hypothetical protein NDU88_005120 [Pleurodeles waltl]|uniref:Uncharacterized protein n=1 Tax=Pleurodeles waltl TaxID=8319 RepID=A0AAV7WAW8_PLEWA|nr:hypothetical protein NDU88_005120 [Pleurodeles waltl]